MNARSKDIVPAQTSVAERAALALNRHETEIEILSLVEQSKPIVAVTDNKSREVCHESLMTLTRLRTTIQRRGKEGREEATQYSKAVIAIEKELIGLLTPEESRLLKLRDDFDAEKERIKQAAIDAEVAHVNAIKERIEELRGNQLLTPASGSKLIAEHISDLQAITVDESFAEFADQASTVKTATLTRLAALLDAAIAHEEAQQKIEAERAELARLREEQAEREAAEKVAREAESAARAKARERQEAEDMAKQEANRLRNEMAMQELQAIHHQLIIADTGRAPYCKGGDLQTFDWLIDETEKWSITETKFGALTSSALRTRDTVLLTLRKRRAELIEHDRQVAEARAHAQQLAEQKRLNDEAAEKLARDRADFEAQQEAARKAAEPKPTETGALPPEGLITGRAVADGVDSHTQLGKPAGEPVGAEDQGARAPSASLAEPPISHIYTDFAAAFLSSYPRVTDWHRNSFALAIKMATEDWLDDFRAEMEPERTEEDTDVPW